MRAYRMVKQSLLVMSILFLTSCSLLTPVKSKPDTKYMIATIPEIVPTSHARSATIMVMQPDTVPAYSTTDMAYSCKPFQIAYYAQNRWAETPSQMLMPLIVQTLQNTHRFHAVVSPPIVSGYDVVLSTTILKLQQDYTCRPPKLKFRARAQLINANTNRVIATKEFCVRESMEPCPYGGVIAANEAVKQFLQELAAFTLRKLST